MQLDEEQQRAVKATEGALCIVAGPGSGKTRTLTERIYFLINEKNVHPKNILAITFTNKTADELRERIEKRCGNDKLPCIRTFHSLAYQILKQHGELIGIPRDFTVALKQKNQNELTFDDLLPLALKLFEKHKNIREHYQNRFQYISVDEYQDTNRLQAEIIRLLRPDGTGVTVVGDDAQSIYSFRGATVRNILEFPEQFPNTQIIKLEQNYRSTQQILQLANLVIDQQTEGYPKQLRSERTSNEWRVEPGQLIPPGITHIRPVGPYNWQEVVSLLSVS